MGRDSDFVRGRRLQRFEGFRGIANAESEQSADLASSETTVPSDWILIAAKVRDS